MKGAYNYFKHADRDHDQKLERFNPEINEVLIFAACSDFEGAFKTSPPILRWYVSFFITTHPHLLKDSYPKKSDIMDAAAALTYLPGEALRTAAREVLQNFLMDQKIEAPIKGWA